MHLLKYSLLVKARDFSVNFWPLVFPLILATLFYFAFGNMDEADFETVPTAVVVETDSAGEKAASADSVFLDFLHEMEMEESRLIKVEEMSESEALQALEEKKVSGIFFVGDEISLSVAGNGISESILQSLLESYENGKQTLENIVQIHPEGMQEAIRQMEDYEALVEQISLGGRTTDGNVQFFYALVAMACLYGSFIGLRAAIALQANLTPLAARRCVTPTHKLRLILLEMFSSFFLHFMNVVILLIYLRYILKLDFQGQTDKMLIISFIGSMIGVSFGIFVGSIGKMGEGAKIGILIGISMVFSFLSGLMNAEMKYMVDQYMPIINRINPAALISDAFYCINVYDDQVRYRSNLVTLSVMCIALIAVSFYMIRRERYDNI